MLLRLCYAMCGTELAYAATSFIETELEEQVLAPYAPTLCSYQMILLHDPTLFSCPMLLPYDTTLPSYALAMHQHPILLSYIPTHPLCDVVPYAPTGHHVARA
eukprot:3934646-Rhodomonas_salina.1